MFGGYYTIASGLLTRQREQDVIGNNLVNVNTPGYRAEKMLTGSFEQELALRVDGNNSQTIGGSMHTSAVVDSIVQSGTSGVVKNTGRSLDFAINGPGMFVVKGDNGQNYLTRNGQFDIDTEGYLVVEGVGRVQDNGADIRVNGDNFTVDEQGNMFTSDGTKFATLSTAVVDENAEFIKQNNGMLVSSDGQFTYQTGTTTVHQGNIEFSNVDMNLELTSLIASQRGFQSCSSALQTIDDMNRKAASKIGSLT